MRRFYCVPTIYVLSNVSTDFFTAVKYFCILHGRDCVMYFIYFQVTIQIGLTSDRLLDKLLQVCMLALVKMQTLEIIIFILQFTCIMNRIGLPKE